MRFVLVVQVFSYYSSIEHISGQLPVVSHKVLAAYCCLAVNFCNQSTFRNKHPVQDAIAIDCIHASFAPHHRSHSQMGNCLFYSHGSCAGLLQRLLYRHFRFGLLLRNIKLNRCVVFWVELFYWFFDFLVFNILNLIF